MLKKLACLLLVSLASISSVIAEPGGDLNLNNKASLVSRDGYNLNLGTEGDEDIIVIQNNSETFRIDGATGTVSFAGSLALPSITTSTSPFVFTISGDAQRLLSLGASSDTAFTFTYGDGGVTASQSLLISASTSDADDDGLTVIAGGGGNSSSRGALCQFSGNENGSGGYMLCEAGALASGAYYFDLNHSSGAFNIRNSSNANVASVTHAGALTTAAGITATTGNISTTTGNFVAASGTGIQLNAFVPTLAATPVAGTNYFAPGMNIIPTNAANNAGYLGVGTPVVGQRFVIYNNSGSSQRIKALGSAGINGGATGTYLVLGYTATAECYSQATGNQLCDILAAPTSQGP